MKKHTLMIAALLTVLSSAVFANEGENSNSKTSIEVQKTEAHLFNLVYKSTNEERVSIKIVDENNQVVFSESIKNHDSFVRPYNLSKLPEGTYTLKVIDSNGTRTHQITNLREASQVVAKSQSIVRFSSLEPNKYLMTIVNADTQDAKINIYNQNSELVYTNTELLNGNYAKIYNLKKVNAGLVEVEINGEVNTFKL